MKKRTLWTTIAVLALAASVLVALGCGDDNKDNKSSNAKFSTINSGTLTVGSDIPYKPFEFGDSPDYQGFDVELVDEIAKKLDLKAKFVKTPFDDRCRLREEEERRRQVGAHL
jgi:polar amino acid transport system substrate-binding protein